MGSVDATNDPPRHADSVACGAAYANGGARARVEGGRHPEDMLRASGRSGQRARSRTWRRERGPGAEGNGDSLGAETGAKGQWHRGVHLRIAGPAYPGSQPRGSTPGRRLVAGSKSSPVHSCPFQSGSRCIPSRHARRRERRDRWGIRRHAVRGHWRILQSGNDPLQ